MICSNSVGRIVESFGGINYTLNNVGVTNLGTSVSFILTAGDVLVLDGTSVTSGEIDDDFGSGVAIWRPGKYVGEFYGSITSGSATNAAGSRVAYLADVTASTNSISGGFNLWGTNAPAGDGTFTNSNSRGASNVYVGPAYLAITNGPFAINAGKSPATPRVMVRGSGVATYQNTNSFAATNGANYSVMDAAGTFTNSARVKTPEVQATDVYATRVRAGTPSLPSPGLWGSGSSDSALRLPINGRIVWTIGNNDYDTPSTGAVISNLASGLKLSTTLTVSGSVTATNGFISHGTSDLAAIKTGQIQYPTNLTANIAAPI